MSENGEKTDESDGNDRAVEVAVAATGAAGAASSDDVEIPQQQTAEKAADNGAGESARK
ncbi:gliding motility protein [Streptomyces fagopyri]|uniref:gliding motility protein n=1 Tax=Streptomyces fagopyri TaxID=2662397 RepID=UPI00367A8607